MNQRESLPVSRDAVDDPMVAAADAAGATAAPGASTVSTPHAPATPAAPPRAMGQSFIHESARAQVAGAALYLDDLPEVKGTL